MPGSGKEAATLMATAALIQDHQDQEERPSKNRNCQGDNSSVHYYSSFQGPAVQVSRCSKPSGTDPSTILEPSSQQQDVQQFEDASENLSFIFEILLYDMGMLSRRPAVPC